MDIKREIFDELEISLNKPGILALIGPRQVGKTYLLKKLYSHLKSQSISASYFDMEMPKDINLFSKPPSELLEQFDEFGDYVFIDEFQYLRNCTKFLKAVVDSNSGKKIIVSGSSSIEIHKHLKESLAGRIEVKIIRPLSLKEFRQTGAGSLENRYKKYGALPGLLNIEYNDDKIEYLKQLTSAYILKDIRSLIKDENIQAFNNLVYILAENQGSIVSHASISRETGVTIPTVKHFLMLLEHTYITHPVLSYSNNLGNELKKSHKYYLYDLGIRNLILKDFRSPIERDDLGVINESYIYLNLIKQIKPNMEIRFWRTKQGDEVDFILVKNRIPVPIEVKSSLSNNKIPKGMKKFLKNYPKSPYGYIYNNSISTIKVLDDGRKIFFKKHAESANCEYLINS